MSSIVMDERVTPPSAPASGKQSIYIDANNGPSVIKDNGDITTFKSEFGSNFGTVNSSTIMNNSSLTPSNYLVLSRVGLLAGVYMAMFKVRYGINTAGRNLIISLTNNGVDIPGTRFERELKDIGSDIREPSADFTTVVLSGDVDLAIAFAPEQAGDLVTIYSAEIILFRVA